MARLLFVAIGVVVWTQWADAALYMERDLAEIDSIFNEAKCIHQGGLCVIESDCPEPTSIKGLCPQQQARGVECCYGVSRKETRCSRHGGTCVDVNSSSAYCPPALVRTNVSDCGKDMICCVYI